MINETIHDGLILRSLSAGVESDRQRLPKFYETVFAEHEDGDEEFLNGWTEDLIAGRSTSTLDDIWVVVDPAQDDKIVSATLLIPQTWQYEDMPFDVGRVELVATDPAYRNRGLVRLLIETLHKRSAESGHLLQAITGISHYYRQFGYGMSLDLGVRGTLPLSHIPKLGKDKTQDYNLRQATTDDIPLIQQFGDERTTDHLLTDKRDAEQWAQVIAGEHHPLAMPYQIYMIENTDGVPVGYTAFRLNPLMGLVRMYGLVVGGESSYLAVFDDVLRELKRLSDAFFASYPPEKHPKDIHFSALMPTVVDQLIRYTEGGVLRQHMYAWYIRVPDLSAFLMYIRPVLERRLAGSGANRYTGTLSVNFYDKTGVVMTFADGELTQVEHKRVGPYKHDAGLPYNTFLDLVFGCRDVDTIQTVLPEAFVNKKAAILLAALFPKKRSALWAVD